MVLATDRTTSNTPVEHVADHNAAHALLNGRVVVRKSADEIVNNSTTFQNDNHLLFAVAAGETWVGRFVIFHTGDATADIKFAVTFPASTTIMYGARVMNASSNAVHTPGLITTSGGSLGASGNSAAGAVTEVMVACVATVAGTVTLQWAQNVLTVADTTVKAGSFLIAERVT
jgi:hypothetical protein